MAYRTSGSSISVASIPVSTVAGRAEEGGENGGGGDQAGSTAHPW
jgi:hypothetical protein